jgi:hypothetical protein
MNAPIAWLPRSVFNAVLYMSEMESTAGNDDWETILQMLSNETLDVQTLFQPFRKDQLTLILKAIEHTMEARYHPGFMCLSRAKDHILHQLE